MLILIAVSVLLGMAIAGLAQEVKNPDTLIIADYGTVNSLDPAYAYDTASGSRIMNIYETLIFWDGEKIDEFVPMLATRVPSTDNGLLSADGMTYIFPIREGVKFHNGEILTPEDVEYTFERAMVQDRSGGPIWMFFEPLLGIGGSRDKAGEISVDFADIDNAIEVMGTASFSGSKPPMNLSWPSWPVAGAESSIRNSCWKTGGWDGTTETWQDFNGPAPGEEILHAVACGTGPFELERWDPAVETVLIRNDDYWREPAKLERVVFKYIEEWTTRKLMFLAGDVDVVQVDTQYIQEMEGIEGIRIYKDLPGLVVGAAFYNFKINPEGNTDMGSGQLDGQGIPPDFFSDKDVRLAFSYSFDWTAFLRDVYFNEVSQPSSPIINGLPYINPEQPVYSRDRAKAEEHFQKAWGGKVWENGFKFTILYNTGNAQRRTGSHIFEDNVEALNPKFSIEVRPVEWATYLDELITNKLTLFILGWGADYPDPHNFVHPFMHTDGSFSAFQSYSNPEVDRLIAEGIASVDPAKRQEIYYRLQEIYYEDVPSVGLYQPLERRYERDWVKGWYYNSIIPNSNTCSYLYSISKG